MIKLAESESRIEIPVAILDQQPLLLNVLNGTIDVRTGKLRPHRRDDYLTQLAPVEYNPSALCPNWRAFLDRIMNRNSELIAYLQRVTGYVLTGLTIEQCLFILYGLGANGKTTYVTTLQKLLGQYAKQTRPELLLIGEHEQHPTGLADLRGSRLVVSTEIERGKRFAESLVKQMTGGDRLKARLMHKDFFEFEATFKLFIETNYKPGIRGTDYAIWRRMRLIPFEVTIAPAEQDRSLAEALEAELPGILNWAIEGWLAWQRVGLQPPETILAATQEYRNEMDVLAPFITACCRVNPLGRATAAELYAEYARWVAANDISNPLSQKRFGATLKERGFRNDRSDHSRGTIWTGIALRKKRPTAVRSA